jgi:transcriptional regulator with XRE-family HTH domain
MNKKIHFVTDKFKQFRVDRDWSQTQMAEFLTLQLGYNVSRAMIQKWEERERAMKAISVLDISKVLSIPVAELVQHNG